MKIKQLMNGTSDVAIEGKVISKGDTREVNTRFGTKDICSFKLEDDTGTIDFSLWEDKIETVREGDTLTITDAYVTEYNGSLQLNIPKNGTMEIKK